MSLQRKRRELEDLSKRVQVAKGVVKGVELPIKLLTCDSILPNVETKTLGLRRSAILRKELPKKRVAKRLQKQPDWLGSPAKFEPKEETKEETKARPHPQVVFALPPVILEDGSKSLWSTQTVKIKVSSLSPDDRNDLKRALSETDSARESINLLRKEVNSMRQGPLREFMLKQIEKRRNQIKASLDWFLECLLFPLIGLGVEGRKYFIWLDGLVGPDGVQDRNFTVHRQSFGHEDAGAALIHLRKDTESIFKDLRSIREIATWNPCLDGLDMEKIDKILESGISLQELQGQLKGLLVDEDGQDSPSPSSLQHLLFGSLKEYVEAQMTKSEFSYTCASAIDHSEG